MKLSLALKTLAAASVFALAGGVHAATVYCPGGAGAPSSGRYVTVENGAVGGYCFYMDGNLQNADITALGLTTIDKNGTSGSAPGTLLSSGFGNGSTSGTWTLTDPVTAWAGDYKLYLAFHFGNGGGSPDSFVVELADGATSGAWNFLAILPDKVNGLSNYYLLSGPGGYVPPDEIPEPASAALIGLGLLAAAAVRRRRKD